MNESTALSQQFHQIIAQHKGILMKVARTYCLHKDDREDLIQEMMIQIWRALPRYNDQFAITTWLYRITLNVAISYYRKGASYRNVRLPLTEQHLSIVASGDSEKEQQLTILEQLINELKELDKALILLYLEDKSYAEIADILGLSLSNVSTKVGRIKDMLKKRFSHLKTL